MICIYEYDGTNVTFKPSRLSVSDNSTISLFNNNITLSINDTNVFKSLQNIQQLIIKNLNSIRLKSIINSKLIVYNDSMTSIFYNAIIDEMNFDYTSNNVDLNIIFDYHDVILDCNYDILKRKDKIGKILKRIEYEKN